MSEKSMNFTCPYCNRPTTITGPNSFSDWRHIVIAKSTLGNAGLFSRAITCPNKECNKLWLHIGLYEADYAGRRVEYNRLNQWQLLPESEARVLPEYIPAPIQEDYYEACRIRDLSPKASATLARRCLQGMIRDFWKIKKARLKEEVDALEEKVDADTWSSIDAVRSVGNIGAHMERDIDVIVAVEPQEAQLLIGLIEQLIDDWYVARDSRHKRTEELKKLAMDKQEQRSGAEKKEE